MRRRLPHHSKIVRRTNQPRAQVMMPQSIDDHARHQGTVGRDHLHGKLQSSAPGCWCVVGAAAQHFEKSPRHFLAKRLVIATNKHAFVFGGAVSHGRRRIRRRKPGFDRELLLMELLRASVRFLNFTFIARRKQQMRQGARDNLCLVAIQIRMRQPFLKKRPQGFLIVVRQRGSRRERRIVQHVNDHAVGPIGGLLIGKQQLLERQVTLSIVNQFDICAVPDPFAQVLRAPARFRRGRAEFQPAINRIANELQAVHDQSHFAAGAVQPVPQLRARDLERGRPQHAAQLGRN